MKKSTPAPLPNGKSTISNMDTIAPLRHFVTQMTHLMGQSLEESFVRPKAKALIIEDNDKRADAHNLLYREYIRILWEEQFDQDIPSDAAISIASLWNKIAEKLNSEQPSCFRF